MKKIVTANDVCDYIILRLSEDNSILNNLKLQKLLYYVQAWHCAFYHRPLFSEQFQAWIHGPVCRPVYDRFSENKSLYSFMEPRDVREGFDPEGIPKKTRKHIDSVLEVYAGFNDVQLEEMTHSEEPWSRAREGFRSFERCERIVDPELMGKYYRQRLEADS